nr:MAG TPA_asm: mitochondrial RNA-binding protein 2, mitochondrial [Caudoviricetes sp.]
MFKRIYYFEDIKHVACEGERADSQDEGERADSQAWPRMSCGRGRNRRGQLPPFFWTVSN